MEQRYLFNLYVLIFSDDWDFGLLSSAHVSTPNITNVTPSDYNYDGRLDLLGTSSLVLSNSLVTGTMPDGSYYVKLYLGNNKELQGSTCLPISDLYQKAAKWSPLQKDNCYWWTATMIWNPTCSVSLKVCAHSGKTMAKVNSSCKHSVWNCLTLSQC